MIIYHMGVSSKNCLLDPKKTWQLNCSYLVVDFHIRDPQQELSRWPLRNITIKLINQY